MKTYLRILKFAKGYLGLLPQFLVFTILYSIFSVVNLSVLIPLLKVLFKTDGAEEQELVTVLPPFEISIDYFIDAFHYYFNLYATAHGQQGALLFICCILMSSILLANVFRYLSGIVLAKVRAFIIRDMRKTVFESVSRLQLGYFTDARKGDIVSRVTTDILWIESTVVGSLKVIFKEPFMILSYFVVLFKISAELTLYSLLILPVAGVIIAGIAKRLKKKAIKSQESLGKINSILDETLSGIRIIKAFTARLFVFRKFESELQNYARLNISIARRFELAGPVSEFLGALALVSILLIGGGMILSQNSNLDAAQFITFLVVFSQVLNPAKSISNSFSGIQRGIAAGERVFQLADAVPTIVDKKDATEITELRESIEISHVSFKYETETVLKNINLKVSKGKTIALVGPSGGGKSTLADLIPRFYDPTEGEVKIDGISLRDYKTESVRKLMGVVTQESILFNDTLFNNIAFGQPEADEKEVIAAAKIANAHDFIMSMEAGYQTSIGERGAKLSGGQRQRISIARAVLKNPPILILDEATSSLDSESEKLVQGAINNLMKNRTSIIIAHRLSTIQNADEIIVLKDGEILQRGNHEKLSGQDGLYKKLSSMQSF